jgi:hypothetical protein
MDRAERLVATDPAPRGARLAALGRRLGAWLGWAGRALWRALRPYGTAAWRHPPRGA